MWGWGKSTTKIGRIQFSCKLLLHAWIVPEKLWQIFIVWKLKRKENGQMKGCILACIMFPNPTIQHVNVYPCTKFKVCRLNSSWETVTNFYCLKTEEKGKWANEGLYTSLHHVSQSHNTTCQCLSLYQV